MNIIKQDAIRSFDISQQPSPNLETVGASDLAMILGLDALWEDSKKAGPNCQVQEGELESVEAIFGALLRLSQVDQASLSLFNPAQIQLSFDAIREIREGELFKDAISQLLSYWTIAAMHDKKTAQFLVDALNGCIDSINNDAWERPEHYRSIAKKRLAWPCLMNHRSVDKKNVQSPAKLLKKIELSVKHPEREMKPLGGDLGREVELHYRILMTLRHRMSDKRPEVQDARALPELAANKATVEQWFKASWKMFEDELGPEFYKKKPFRGFVGPYEEKSQVVDGVRKKLRSAWTTLAKRAEKGRKMSATAK